MGHNKELIRFGDFDIIFKVTAVEKLKIHGVGPSFFSENIVTSCPPPFRRKVEGHCFWFSVGRGAWCVARGAWRVARGAWCVVPSF